MLNENDKEYLSELLANMVDEKLGDLKINEGKFFKWAKGWFFWLSPVAIISGVWQIGVLFNQFEERVFDDSSQKQEHIIHVNNAPDPIVLDAVTKHATEPGIHMPKNQKDSIYVTRYEYLELIKSNAVDTYNMKRTIDKVYESQKEMTKTMKALEYKMDRN